MLKSLAALTLATATLLPAASAGAAQVHSSVASSIEARMDSNPYVVRLEMYMPLPDGSAGPQMEGFCSGSLISSRYVLTAAHCVSEDVGLSQEAVDELEPRVRFLNKEGLPAVKVKRVAYYGSYDEYSDGRGLDIALLELSWDAPVSPVQISTLSPFHPGQQMKVYGYGQYKKNSLMSDTLRYGSNVNPADPDRCVSQTGGYVKVHDYQICTVTDLARGWNSEPCPGDSGGPLLDPAGNLVGVTSFGQYLNCDVSPGKRSGVYARASSGIDWMLRQTGVPLMGRPAVAQELAAPSGARVQITSLTSRRVRVTASADGSDWDASIRVRVARLTKRGSLSAVSGEVELNPDETTAEFSLPRSFRSSKVRRIYAVAYGRFWNHLENGVSTESRLRSIRP